MDSEFIGVWSVDVDHGGFVVSLGYPNGQHISYTHIILSPFRLEPSATCVMN